MAQTSGLAHYMQPPQLTYAKPKDSPRYVSVNPRPLQLLERPPARPPPPNLPNPPVRESPLRGYQLTSHIVPAAYPRQPGNLPPKIPQREAKEARKERVKQLAKNLLDARLAERKGIKRADVQETALYNVFNRYVLKNKPKRGGDSVTLLVLHANGLPKETWEPCLGFLIDEMNQSNESPLIEEIWTMDAVNHGDSGLVNEVSLTDRFDWADHARDILNFTTNFLPESGCCSPPVHLTAVEEHVARRRIETGFKDRTLVALGHSFGGCSVTRAALDVPKLFSSLILVDPVIVPCYKVIDGGFDWMTKRAVPALSRRTTWPSRQEAMTSFLQSNFFKVWHPDVLRSYVDYGITPDLGNGGFRLKCSGYQEAAVFSDVVVARETWELLNQLDENTELYWIMAGIGAEVSGGEEAAQQVVWRRDTNTANVRVVGAGHLIAQEKPRELAALVAAFLQKKYGRTSNKRARL